MDVALSLLQRRSSKEDDSELLSEYLPCIYIFALGRHFSLLHNS